MEKPGTMHQLKRNQQLIKSKSIEINSGILHGDSFSPRLSSTGPVPLTQQSNRANYTEKK
jgi:hypothetical protein